MCEKGLGASVDHTLNINQQCDVIVLKANGEGGGLQ